MDKEKIDWNAIFNLNWRNFLFRLTILISIIVPVVHFLNKMGYHRYMEDPLSLIILSLQICVSVWFMYGLLWIVYLISKSLLKWLGEGLTKGLKKK